MIMAVVYCYLENYNDKIMKFYMNNSSFFKSALF